MNKKNLKYKKYFTRLNSTLIKINNNFLYYIPSLFKKDLRKDKISIIKIKFSFFKSLFGKSYLCDNIFMVKKAKICFVSHYVGNKINDKNFDFYYGSLFKKLNIKIPFYLLLINHTDEKLEDIQKKFKNSEINRVYVNNSFNALSDVWIICIITFNFVKFKFTNFINYKEYIKANKINHSFNYNFFLSSRFTYKISNRILHILNKSNNLKNVVTTYEGHSYEKIIFNYCKNKKIKSFGYFFSVIREYKNSIYYRFNQKYQPDVVLTSGDIAKQDLKSNSPHTNIQTLGKNKILFKKKYSQSSKNKKKITILVCPEGLFSETIEMLKLINNKLLDNQNITFIFRTHPLIDIKRDFKKIILNKNIFISKESDIKKDFIKSNYILYSGSSVSIYAIMNGLIPINYKNNKNEFSLDPFYKINNLIVKNPLTLLNLLKKINKSKHSTEFRKKLHKTQKYANLYFKKLNTDILIKSID